MENDGFRGRVWCRYRDQRCLRSQARGSRSTAESAFRRRNRGPNSIRPSKEEEIPTLRGAGDLTRKDGSLPQHLQGGNLATELEENTAVAKKSSAPSAASVVGPGTAAEVTSVAAVATTTVDASAVANSAAPPPMASSRTAGFGPVRNAGPIVGRTVRFKTNAMAEASSQTLQPESSSAKATSPSNAATLPIVSGQQLGGVVWSVQLAATKSETQAERDATRLETRYASALNGRMIGVQKAVVGAESIYRVRVVGLSKADAKASCAHVKRDGGECFIVK
jgi:SPOR domain